MFETNLNNSLGFFCYFFSLSVNGRNYFKHFLKIVQLQFRIVSY